ncbi:MAG: hypothetical protein MUP99_01255, partial [Pedobacter sp.]|nr:hypothetical protein [Pedobacter sp.]
MKTFYSILYCAIRPNLDEKVSIGLFMGNEEHCKFLYSADKLSVIKDLFSDMAFNTIKLHLRSLLKLSSECELDYMHAYKGRRVFKEEYFSYLSRYSQNLITYSQPVAIDIDITTSAFNKLFEKFIYQLPQEVLHKEKPLEKIKKRLVKSIASHVNFDVELNS